MKNYILLFLTLASLSAFAQRSDYFQQAVNYKIDVTLDDEKHTISGDIEMEYTNNSPSEMDTIFIHLWGNAFSQRGTAYDRQKLRNGSTSFYFTDDKNKGGYSGLDWKVDGKTAQFFTLKNDPDIGVLILPDGLRKGKKAILRTPFTLKIPASFSRLGHVGTSYQMTQWYPKPAVFDRKGHHPMPYLDMGEFFSEFGNFDVTITLPDNYVVGASGTLQTATEKEFLQNKVLDTKALLEKGFEESTAYPASSEKMKTIRYVAEKVHDFAWFADKRFHVLHEEAVLPSGKKVDCWAMFTNEEADIWTRGAEYVKRSTEFYSQHVGEYPWPQATAVQSALSAGGGMEYPMITVIGRSGNAESLDDVITHEVGHNWFYGILATDERLHPWMDEGMNSYYEYRYMRKYYGHRMKFPLPKVMCNHTHHDIFNFALEFNGRRNLDQAPDTHSDEQTQTNYGLGAYVKPGSALEYLEAYLGTENFDRAMKKYYETWKFKHPYPEDFRQVIESETGKDLSWLFDGLLFSTKKMDYSLETASQTGEGWQLTVKNEGEFAAPFPISGMKDGEVVETVWFEPAENEQVVDFPKGDYDLFILDENHRTLDINRQNNNLKTSGIFPKFEPVNLGFLGLMDNNRKSSINFAPILGWNKYDGPMFGIGFHNGLLPARKWEVQWAPLYGFDSQDLVGMAGLHYNLHPKSEKIRRVRFSLTSKAFNFDKRPSNLMVDSMGVESGFPGTHLQYRRIVPSVKLDLRRSLTSSFYQTLELRSIWLEEEFTTFDTAGVYAGNEFDDRVINRLDWEIGNRRALNPYSFRVGLEHQNTEVRILDSDTARFEDQNHIRASFELKSSYTYDRGRSFDIRLFVGTFFQSEDRANAFSYHDNAFNLSGEGFNDYRYDELFFGRNEPDGVWRQQISEREGGMKIPLGSASQNIAGRSNSFMFTVNIVSDLPQDLPGNIPLRPYFDLGYYQDKRPIASDLETSDRIWWQGGVTLELLRGIVGIHMPVVNSSRVKDLYNQSGRDNFFKQMAFRLDLFKLNAWDIAEGIEF